MWVIFTLLHSYNQSQRKTARNFFTLIFLFLNISIRKNSIALKFGWELPRFPPKRNLIKGGGVLKVQKPGYGNVPEKWWCVQSNYIFLIRILCFYTVWHFPGESSFVLFKCVLSNFINVLFTYSIIYSLIHYLINFHPTFPSHLTFLPI